MDEIETIRRKSKILQYFNDNVCPAEIILPYSLEPKQKKMLSVWFESRYRGPIYNMDFPWIVTMYTSLVLVIGWAALVAINSNFGFGSSVLKVVASFPIFFMVLSPLFYPLLEGSNLRLAYGKNWLRSLVGPTHISITDSGFKFYWRGRFFYNYPSLAIWPEIFDLDLIDDHLYNCSSIQFVYQTGFGRRVMILPLIGFETSEDLELVLDSFAQFVPEENLSDRMKTLKESRFEALIDEYHNLKDFIFLKTEPETEES